MNLEGKVAIVTGGSGGIGRMVVEQLADLQAAITVNYSGNGDKALEIVETVRRKGGKALAIQADVSKLNDIDRLFEETIQNFGQVDILVNSAGIMLNTLLMNVTEEEFDDHFSINVKGTYFACQQAMKHMQEYGRIVNFSTSIVGAMFPAYSVYAATKGAVEQLTRHLSKEFGSKGITVNAIAPGPVKTELFLKGKSEQQIEALSKMNAFNRLGEPDDIAEVIEFLVSDKAHWVTGQTLRANGGFN